MGEHTHTQTLLFGILPFVNVLQKDCSRQSVSNLHKHLEKKKKRKQTQQQQQEYNPSEQITAISVTLPFSLRSAFL